MTFDVNCQGLYLFPSLNNVGQTVNFSLSSPVCSSPHSSSRASSLFCAATVVQLVPCLVPARCLFRAGCRHAPEARKFLLSLLFKLAELGVQASSASVGNSLFLDACG